MQAGASASGPNTTGVNPEVDRKLKWSNDKFVELELNMDSGRVS